LALCLLSLGACGREGFVLGGRDTRTGIVVPAAARTAVLAEMGTMLGSLNGVLIAQTNGDTAAVRLAALASGAAASADPVLERILPDAWMQLAASTHQQFDQLAASAVRPHGSDSITVRLARLTGNCVACHRAYRLDTRQ
jgi:cytochrome c556